VKTSKFSFQISITIKVFVTGKTSATEKKKEPQTLFINVNTKPLQFKCGLADGGEGQAGGPMQGMGTHTQYNIID
jgi:hypothetical protein